MISVASAISAATFVFAGVYYAGEAVWPDAQAFCYSNTAYDTALSYCSDRPGVCTKSTTTICSFRFTHQYVP